MAEVGAVLADVLPSTVAADEWSDEDAARPTEPLPLRQLAQISIYWLGINAIMGGIGIAIQERVPGMVPLGEKGTYLALRASLIIGVNIVVQPTVGMISDYTVSRWGRRKPYIAIGATLDVVFLIGLATVEHAIVDLSCSCSLLQFSSNFAQGPFQGYVPDLVPAGRSALASAMVGAMQILGSSSAGSRRARSAPATPARLHAPDDRPRGHRARDRDRDDPLGPGGRAPRDRRGRSWLAIAKSAWGTDILRERSFLWLVVSRLLFLAGIARCWRGSRRSSTRPLAAARRGSQGARGPAHSHRDRRPP